MKFDLNTLHFGTPVKQADFADDVTYIAKIHGDLSYLIRRADNHGYIIASLRTGIVSFHTLDGFIQLYTSPAEYYVMEGRDLTIFISPKN